jgi:hypothetical protein
MLMTVLKANGERTEAVLLAIGDSRMRVVIRGLNNTTELRLIQDQWMSENGVAIDIESLIPIEFQLVLDHGKKPRTMTAGA